MRYISWQAYVLYVVGILQSLLSYIESWYLFADGPIRVWAGTYILGGVGVNGDSPVTTATAITMERLCFPHHRPQGYKFKYSTEGNKSIVAFIVQ